MAGGVQIKTSRAMAEYCKSEYPHYGDKLTLLENIGPKVVLKLRDLRAVVDEGVPVDACRCVGELKQLVEYCALQPALQERLKELLNMKVGRKARRKARGERGGS